MKINDKCVPAEGEPFFILLGRDPQAPALIEKWSHDRALLEPGSKKADSALDIAFEMREYKRAHPDIGNPPIADLSPSALLMNAIAATRQFADWAHQNEANFTGWGDGEVPKGAYDMRCMAEESCAHLNRVWKILTKGKS